MSDTFFHSVSGFELPRFAGVPIFDATGGTPSRDASIMFELLCVMAG